MNLFYLDHDVSKSVQYHLDKHVVKLVTEYAQLLSAAHHVLNSGVQGCMALSHVNHPCAVFTRTSSENYDLVYRYYIACAKEYQYRYGKVHASLSKYHEALRINPVPKGKLTEIPQCMPDECKRDCPVEAYREYYKQHKIPQQGYAFSNRFDPPWV